jgi:DNA-binding NarL/FixJ family response regulator
MELAGYGLHKGEGIKNPKLLPQELEVLRLISVGVPFKEITRSLHITLGVARNYSFGARQKLGARSNAHAVAIAMKLHLLDIEIEITEKIEV